MILLAAAAIAVSARFAPPRTQQINVYLEQRVK